MTDYQRKLYAFLQAFHHSKDPDVEHHLCATLQCLQPQLTDLRNWWQSGGNACLDIAASSDRVNLQTHTDLSDDVEVRHPISGQQQTVAAPDWRISIPEEIQRSTNAQQVFWWFWRFYPEYLAQANPQAHLYPAHRILPDCPLHSYQSTVSALAGAMFTGNTQSPKQETPYLLLFSFSPVQEFIKASRKFLDFWAGSYMLHYLSARLCWYVAKEYGPDSIIVPSLWSQDIIDAFWLKQHGQPMRSSEANTDYSEEFSRLWQKGFDEINDGLEPVERFEAEDDKRSNSLGTAGFPNMITVLVPGKAKAEQLGQHLTKVLTEEWQHIGLRIRDDIRQAVINYLTNQIPRQERLERLQHEQPEALLDHQICEDLLNEAFPDTTDSAQRKPYHQELAKLIRESNWEWRHLWDAQLSHTWEPYWSAVPLGVPDRPYAIAREEPAEFDADWLQGQQAISFSAEELEIPTAEEKALYQNLNIGSWWGSLQERLRIALQTVKNTRTWHLPAAPGERSSISGQSSAAHPRLNYQGLFREGAGVPESSLRLFWLVMSKAYPGLFNGSERLNTLELTKRMAWKHGGVAETLGIPTPDDEYENLVRFPNLSSIAAASFVQTAPELTGAYWKRLQYLIRQGDIVKSGVWQEIKRRPASGQSSGYPPRLVVHL